ncbi:MAG: hypothetical protein PVI78_04985 [Anaerolineales bacterium]|jgi:hypothetical protein
MQSSEVKAGSRSGSGITSVAVMVTVGELVGDAGMVLVDVIVIVGFAVGS